MVVQVNGENVGIGVPKVRQGDEQEITFVASSCAETATQTGVFKSMSKHVPDLVL